MPRTSHGITFDGMLYMPLHPAENCVPVRYKTQENEKIQSKDLQGRYGCDCTVNLYQLGCIRGKWYGKWKPCILGCRQQYLENCPVSNLHFVLAFFIQSK